MGTAGPRSHWNSAKDTVPFSDVFLLFFPQVIQIAVCKSTKLKKDEALREHSFPLKSHLSLTNEDIEITGVRVTCFQ